MELKRIEIKNFRSIKEAEIEFSRNCLILLGKNEAGKSNVLKAVAAIFGQYKVSNNDKRKKINNEIIDPNDYYSRVIIELSEKDFSEIENRLYYSFPAIQIVLSNNGIVLADFIKGIFNEIIIQVDIANDSPPYFRYWSYEEYLPELSHNSTITFNLDDGTELNLIDTIMNIIIEYYLENSIKCHYWQYSDNFLLPSAVDINSFISSPSDFKALEYIFQLCNRENISEEFENAIAQDGDYANLLEQISNKVTKTFQKIWEDLKGTSIQLLPNGNQILIKIVDKAKYNYEDRSDGFKKFISILLMLSTQSRAKKIEENDLILIDEPDQSLYPTSARYLRDELLNIGNKSKIIYSTHSQYMIDTNNLDRHLIVEKKDDVTTLTKVETNAPYTTDELLRRAIGSSIFECLKPVNIVFEGYLDKKLFDQYCQWNKKESEFKDYGKIYLQGISGIDSIVSILDAANKKFIVVADSDGPSVLKRSEFEKDHPDYKTNWLAYADVASSTSTMEDFLTPSFIESEIKLIKNDYLYDTSKNAIQNIEKAVGKVKEEKQNVKNNLMINLKKEFVKEDYSKYLEELKNRLNNL